MRTLTSLHRCYAVCFSVQCISCRGWDLRDAMLDLLRTLSPSFGGLAKVDIITLLQRGSGSVCSGLVAVTESFADAMTDLL